MTPQALTKLREEISRIHEEWLRKGRRLASYVCPNCGKAQYVRQPKQNECYRIGFWESCKFCLDCGRDATVRVWPSGDTLVVDETPRTA